MINFFEKQFDNLAKNIKSCWKTSLSALKAYFKIFLFPVYLFPIKLITFSSNYLVNFVNKFILAIIALLIDLIVYPFNGLKYKEGRPNIWNDKY